MVSGFPILLFIFSRFQLVTLMTLKYFILIFSKLLVSLILCFFIPYQVAFRDSWIVCCLLRLCSRGFQVEMAEITNWQARHL